MSVNVIENYYIYMYSNYLILSYLCNHHLKFKITMVKFAFTDFIFISISYSVYEKKLKLFFESISITRA